MPSLVTEEKKAKATELYHGHDVCMSQARRLFREVGFPNGLLPLQDVEECGYIESENFVWLKQKKEIDHKFEKIGRNVRYATEITANVDRNKMGKIANLTGVQARELLIWVNINEITTDGPEKVVFKNKLTGVTKVFPTDAFVIEITEPEPEVVNEAAAAKEKTEAAAVAAAPAVDAAPKAVEVKDV